MTSRLILALGLVVASAPALAHHPMDGAMPETLWHGLLSGVGHPIIGLDHLAFVVAAGVLAGLAGRPLLAPLGLVAGALAGAALHLGAISIPGAEILIAASVLVAGVAVALGARVRAAALIAAFAVAGVFHGYAYAEAVVGAEQGVIAAYLVSFSVTQWLIAALAAFGAVLLKDAPAWARMRRIVGGAFALAGAVFLAQAVA